MCLFLLLAGGLRVQAGQGHGALQLHKMSGIYGQVVRVGFAPVNPEENPDAPDIGARIPIANCVVVIFRAEGNKEVARVTSDKNGKWKVMLRPVKYQVATITPDDNPWTAYPYWQPGNMNKPTDVTVWNGFYTEAETIFDGGW
jgi:hypothetical protein